MRDELIELHGEHQLKLEYIYMNIRDTYHSKNIGLWRRNR
jgi:hypothetical protein